MGTDLNAIKRTVILIGAVVAALLNRAFDRRVCFAGLTSHMILLLKLAILQAAGSVHQNRIDSAGID